MPISRILSDEKRPILILVSVFFLSRLALFFADIHLLYFDFKFMHYLDPQILANGLYSALSKLHSQPILFNALLGFVLNAFGQAEAPFVLAVIYKAIGLMHGLLLYFEMRYLGIKPKMSLAATIVFLISPAALLYENYFFHTYPAMFLLNAALFSALVFCQRKSWLSLATFGLLSLVLLFYRSLIHPLWFLGISAILFMVSKQYLKLLASSLIVLFLTGWAMLHNQQLSGHFSLSSWTGINWARATVFRLPESERKALVAQGILKPISLVKPMSPIEDYQGSLPDLKADSKDPSDQLYSWRTPAGLINFHSLAAADISKAYIQDVSAYYRYDFFRALGFPFKTYWGNFLDDPINFHPLDDNKNILKPYIHVFNGFGIFRAKTWLNIIVWHVVLIFLLTAAVKERGPLRYASLMFAWTWIYVSSVSVVFESGETQRFRFLLYPIFFLASAMCIAAIKKTLAMRRGSFPASENSLSSTERSLSSDGVP